jgi:hypothetical protein
MVSFPIRTVLADEGDYELVVETLDLYWYRGAPIDMAVNEHFSATMGAYRTRLQREQKPHLDEGMGTYVDVRDERYHSRDSREPLGASVRHWELVERFAREQKGETA